VRTGVTTADGQHDLPVPSRCSTVRHVFEFCGATHGSRRRRSSPGFELAPASPDRSVTPCVSSSRRHAARRFDRFPSFVGFKGYTFQHLDHSSQRGSHGQQGLGGSKSSKTAASKSLKEKRRRRRRRPIVPALLRWDHRPIGSAGQRSTGWVRLKPASLPGRCGRSHFSVRLGSRARPPTGLDS
jgi:hypothetical protein